MVSPMVPPKIILEFVSLALSPGYPLSLDPQTTTTQIFKHAVRPSARLL